MIARRWGNAFSLPLGPMPPVLKRMLPRRWIFRSLTFGRLLLLLQASGISIVLFLIKPGGEVNFNFVDVVLLIVITVLIFLLIGSTESFGREREESKNRLAATILSIVQASLPVLRNGLDGKSAGQLVDTLHQDLTFDMVTIADSRRVLAHAGITDQHHRPGAAVSSQASKRAFETRQLTLAYSRQEIGCSHRDCPCGSAVLAPLFCGPDLVGTVNFYRAVEYAITDEDVLVASGLSELLSSQLELSQLKAQKELTLEAQVSALKAQIQPHFIFNVLNTIASAALVDAEMARSMTLKLGTLLRKTFRTRANLVALREEFELVRQFLAIEDIRFPGLIDYQEHIEDLAGDSLVPLFLLQPLVENCIHHGSREDSVNIRTSARIIEGGFLQIDVEDDGPGVDEELLPRLTSTDASGGVGIANIVRRLEAFFGPEASLKAFNAAPGLRMSITMPVLSNGAQAVVPRSGLEKR